MQVIGLTSLFASDVSDRLTLYDEILNLGERRHDFPIGLLQGQDRIWVCEVRLLMRHDVG